MLAALKNGPLRKEIEDAGGLKLVYIDPPFNVGADFSFDVEVGEDQALTKQPSIIEEVAYRDTWGKGTDSYLFMMFERLSLMKELLNERGSIYVHCDWRMTSLLRQVLDEIFGNENFQREVIWSIKTASGFKSQANNWIRSHDNILYYTKSSTFTFNKQFAEIDERAIRRYDKVDDDGRRYKVYHSADRSERRVYFDASRDVRFQVCGTTLSAFKR